MTRAVIHLLGGQPVVADLVEDPKPEDIALICTNVRTVDGKRPVFIDASDSRFVFPYATIRFVEIHAARAEGGEARPAETAEPEELELDEEFLRRVREA